MDNGAEGSGDWARGDGGCLLLTRETTCLLLGWLVEPGFYVPLPVLLKVLLRDHVIVLHGEGCTTRLSEGAQSKDIKTQRRTNQKLDGKGRTSMWSEQQSVIAQRGAGVYRASTLTRQGRTGFGARRRGAQKVLDREIAKYAVVWSSIR